MKNRIDRFKKFVSKCDCSPIFIYVAFAIVVACICTLFFTVSKLIALFAAYFYVEYDLPLPQSFSMSFFIFGVFALGVSFILHCLDFFSDISFDIDEIENEKGSEEDV